MSDGPKPVARRVREAIEIAERSICGDGAVESPAIAEGLALAGYRAARVLGEPSTGDPGASGSGCRVAWVDHRPHGGESTRAAFSLAASTAQEAVDHCLVAHRIAAAIGRPGACTVDPVLAESFAVTWLPDGRRIAELPEPLPLRQPVELAEVPVDVIEREAAAALAALEAATGRRVGPVVSSHLENTERVLVGVGDGAVLAREVAAVLRKIGVGCASVAVTLVEPYPTAALREALASFESVTVLGDLTDPFAERLGRRVRAVVGADRRVQIVTTLRPAAPDGPGGLPDAVAAGRLHVLATLELLWHMDLSAAIVYEDPHVAGARIGVYPGGRLCRNLVLDAVGHLAWLSDVRIDCARHAADDVAAVAVGNGPVHGNGPLDLLLVTDPATFRAEGPLRRLRAGGTVLCCAPAGTTVVLTAEQRGLVSARGLRLRRTPETAPQRVASAVLRATSELEPDGSATDLVGSLVAAIPESNAVERLELLAGAAALTDCAAETADVEPASAPAVPTMPRQRKVEDAEALRRALRAFHFTGAVTDLGRSPGPATPLRPAVFPVPDADVGAPMVGDELTLLERWNERVSVERRRRRVDFTEQSDSLVERLSGLLGRRAVGGDDATDDQAIAASLGEFGSEFVDTAELRDKLTSPCRTPSAATLSADRRERLGRLIEALAGVRRRIRATPIAHVLVRDPESIVGLSDHTITRHDDPLRAAIGLFDGFARRAVADARTLRAARLEVDDAFDEPLHGPQLARLDWASLRAAERLLAPTVVVVETARRLRGPALAALSELIRSGRAVHVLVTECVTDLREELDERAGFHPGLGYLAMAHREALVLQSMPGCAAHFMAGLDRAAASLEPVVIVAAAVASDLPWTAAVQFEAALRSRAFPCFRYDPGAGVSWAERFALEANPQPDAAWPTYSVDCVDEVGARFELAEDFTFAHAASLDPGWRERFLVVGSHEWLDDQLPLADWLELADRERSAALPYIWVVDSACRLARAIVAWELAVACRDRGQAWRLLQELGGTHDVYAERAAEQARREVKQQHAERVERLDAEHARALQAERESAGSAAIERLVWALVEPDLLGSSPGSVRIPDAATKLTAAVSQAVRPVGDARTVAAVAERVVAPYIDSFLCTSCNDCVNLNPRLFVYNDDKQATIGDSAKGTFAELVKAAEACPARCIHPGAPREGDRSATPKMRERAARLD